MLSDGVQRRASGSGGSISTKLPLLTDDIEEAGRLKGNELRSSVSWKTHILQPQSWPLTRVFMVLVGITVVLWFLSVGGGGQPLLSEGLAHFTSHMPHMVHKDTLVVYVFEDFDPEALSNLHYFLTVGTSPSDRCDYVVIVQKADNSTQLTWLPRAPGNVRYVYTPFFLAECNGMGVVGWLLINSGQVDVSRYSYYAFLDSSLRGPFLPPYAKNMGMHWTDPFLAKLSSKVKLVGSSIACTLVACPSDSPDPDAKTLLRHHPFVQSMLVTDRVGLKIMMDTEGTFICNQGELKVICNAQMGASGAILNAGYSIDAMMMRYQGVDWHDQRTWDCNNRFDPTVEYQYDGTSPDPLETVFTRMSHYSVEAEVGSSAKALKYQRWALEASKGFPGHIVSNDFNAPGINRLKATLIVEMAARGADCFDGAYYVKNNVDLKDLDSTQLWDHFLKNGQFEGRRFRMTCNMDAETLTSQLLKLANVKP